jgi:hypothetical protein
MMDKTRTSSTSSSKRIDLFLEGKWVYRLIYQAAARYYFDRDLATFETLRESFRLLTKPA